MKQDILTIGDICSRFSSGKNITSESIHSEGEFPVYGGNGLRGYTDSFNFEGECSIIGRQGAYCGNVRYFKGKGYMSDHAVVAVTKPEHNNRYFAYKLGLMNLGRFSGQAAQPGLSVTKVSKLRVEMPPLHVQRRIASILSAYDNLIENNTRRIRLLEQMAENIYKEWFAYHKIKYNCKEVRLTDIVSITRGLSYSSEEIDCMDGNDLINLKNIQAYGGFRLDGTKKYCGKYKTEQVVQEGDLIMGVTDMTQDRRTVGSVALIPNIENLSVISADLIKLESDIDNIYLYAMFRFGGVSRYIAQFANGANVLHLRPQALHSIKILLPSGEMIQQYVKQVKPSISLINKLNTQNNLLARQRDLLLPRLMSGKLEVKG